MKNFLLDDDFLEIDMNEAKRLRDTTGCGFQEACEQMRREQLRNALNALHTQLDRDFKVHGIHYADRVLHDLIEVVKQLI